MSLKIEKSSQINTQARKNKKRKKQLPLPMTVNKLMEKAMTSKMRQRENHEKKRLEKDSSLFLSTEEMDKVLYNSKGFLPSISSSIDENESNFLLNEFNRLMNENSNADSSVLTEAAIGLTYKKSNREMIEEISRRIKMHKSRPAYVSRLQDLSSRLLSWDCKKSSTVLMLNERPRSTPYCILSADESEMTDSLEKSNSQTLFYPKVNIIGCLQPIDLILAKADERLRKQNQLFEQRKAANEDKSKEMAQRINAGSLYNANLLIEQLQFAWIKIILSVRYAKTLRQSYMSIREHLHRLKLSHDSSIKIQNLMKRWFYRHQFRKYRLRFYKILGRNSLLFKLSLRIHLKRKAVHKLRTFLQEQESNSKIGKVVRKFLYAVKKIQNIMRNFLAVRRAALQLINEKWIRLEARYVTHLMDGKIKRYSFNDRSHGGSKATGTEAGKAVVKHNNKKYQLADSISFSELISEGEKIRMKSQSYQWSKINSLMEDKISRLKVVGVIEVVTKEDIINRLMFPVEERMSILRSLIRHMRHQYYANQRSIQQSFYEKSLVFSERDALNLLKGEDSAVNTSINFIMKQRLNNKPQADKSKPFLLLREMSNKVLMKAIVEAQDSNESLQLKVEFEQPLWDKLKQNKI